jgi:LysR family transcriptional regulator for bpeEF and oprC
MHQSSNATSSAAHLASLQTFFRVVERESFRAVARELGVSQPTVSRQIAALEADLGVRLLHRTTRKVSATDAGRALYERAVGPMQELVAAEDDVRAGASALTGVVRIAAPGALGRRLVLPAAAAVVAAHPGLAIDLHVSDQRVSLVDRRVDFAVRVGAQVETSLSVRKLGVSEQVLVASRAYLRRSKRPRTMADLRGHAFVLRADGGAASTALRTELARVGARIVFASDDVEAAYAAILAGLGVGMLPRWLVDDELESGKLVRCLADMPAPSAPVFVVRPTSSWMPRRARLLYTAVVDALSRALATRTGGEDGSSHPGRPSA